jgi:hypothetical protein
MKKIAISLLTICALPAFAEDVAADSTTNITATVSATTPAGPRSQPAPAIDEPLVWNVAPPHWENILGKSFTSTSATNASASSGPVTFAKGFDLSTGGGAGVTVAVDVERVLRKPSPVEGLRLGRSDYTFTSPLLEGLIPRRAPPDASLGEKVLNLPVVRWFRPLPMPQPPGGGKYFKWGERPEPWRAISSPIPGPRALDNGM